MAAASRGPSRTARFVALFRALETRLPAGERLFADPFAEDFLDRRLSALLAAAKVPVTGGLVPAAIDRNTPGARVSVIVRTPFIDTALDSAVASGVEQVVLLGSGFDARAYRLDAASRARVFEVDEPSTLAEKRARIERRLGATPPHVTWAPVDFERDDLEAALRSAGLDPAKPAMFIWEGVTSYLTPEAVDANLRLLPKLGAAGSRLAFTYLHRAALEGSEKLTGAHATARAVRIVGEPFRFGIEPAALGDYLRERGLELIEQSTSAELAERYLHPRGRRPPASPFFNVALAARQED